MTGHSRHTYMYAPLNALYNLNHADNLWQLEAVEGLLPADEHIPQKVIRQRAIGIFLSGYGLPLKGWDMATLSKEVGRQPPHIMHRAIDAFAAFAGLSRAVRIKREAGVRSQLRLLRQATDV